MGTKIRSDHRILANSERLDHPHLYEYYKLGFFKAGYELMFRSLREAKEHPTKPDLSWYNEHEETLQFANDRINTFQDEAMQKRLVLRYLMGIGTKQDPQKAEKLMKGQDPDSLDDKDSWFDLSDDPELNYEFYRYLKTFAWDRLTQSEKTAAGLLLQKALKGGFTDA